MANKSIETVGHAFETKAFASLEDALAIQKEKHGIVSPYGTSSLVNLMQQITTVGGTSGDYNPDVPPLQNPVLKQAMIDIRSPVFREALYQNSTFLAKQTTELIRSIFEAGWVASDGRELPEFDAKMREKAIECAASAQIIDSCYLMKFTLGDEKSKEDKWVVLSSNYVWRRYCNPLRNITEIYFQYPCHDNLFSEVSESGFATEIIGFLTQNTQDKNRPHRFYQGQLSPDLTVTQPIISRNCVCCMPYPHPLYPDGFPFLFKEDQTALEKIYLRFYELIYVHKGGINKTMVIPDGLATDVQAKIAKEYKRGMLSLGGIISVKGVKVPETFLVTETPIPELGLDVINSHLSEDSKVSKQKIEGEAASGALGGEAPQVNAKEDDEAEVRLKPVLAQFLKDIYDVFFQIDSKDYEIEFKEAADETLGVEATAEKNPAASIEAHSVHDDYVEYDAQMLPAGVYKYPERGDQEDFYSRDDIKQLCERSVNKFYLEIDHSYRPDLVELTEGIGYGEIVGFNEHTGADITKLHIKRAIADQLGDKLKISPYFNKVQLSGRKILSVRNCAILKNQTPRAELTGLKSEASRSG